MAHTTRKKEQLLNRIRRIRGQVEAIERENDCSRILHNVAACRGAINGLMGKILEGHIRNHVIDHAGKPSSAQRDAAEEVIELVRRYLK